MSNKQIIRLNRNPADFGKTPDELEQSMFESSIPVQHTHTYYEDESQGIYIGVWDTMDMAEAAGPYACDEFMVLLEGEAVIKNNETGALEKVVAGEAFVIPKGYDCQWQQKGYLRKFFVISEHPDEDIPVKPTVENIVNLNDHLYSEQGSQPDINAKLSGDSFIIKDGKPANKGMHYYQDHSGKFLSGVWKSNSLETKQQAFPRNEFIYIQSGEIACVDGENQSHHFKTGDAFFVPQGTICHWQIPDNVCVFYTTIQNV